MTLNCIYTLGMTTAPLADHHPKTLQIPALEAEASTRPRGTNTWYRRHRASHAVNSAISASVSSNARTDVNEV